MFTLATLEQVNVPKLPVSFENLSYESLERESQKDVLFQALRRLYRNTETFLDHTGVESDDAVLIVRCVNCEGASDAALVLKEGFQRSSFGNNSAPIGAAEKLTVKFDVAVSDKVTAWTVQLEVFKPRYVVLAAQPLSYGQVVTEGDLFVGRCSKIIRCSVATPTFDSSVNAAEALSEYVDMKVQSPIGVNAFVSSARLVPQELIRVSDLVRVKYKDGNLSISMKGRALNSAAKGAKVRVELESNEKTYSHRRKVIDALATASGEVEYVR